MKRVITGMEFGEALVKAGIIPENSGDVIIEVPVSGVVTIHYKAWADERLLSVLSAKVDPAQIREEGE